MHQYKIEVYNYKENGSVGSRFAVKYADNPEQAKVIYDDYASQMQTREIVNEDGTVTIEETGLKKFKVNFYVLAYKQIDAVSAFFAQFTV